MYWPQSVARRLLQPILPPLDQQGDNDQVGESDAGIDDPIQLSPSSPSSHPSHFVLLTSRTLHLYSTRPTICLASLKRTGKSLREYGLNRKAWWRPGSHLRQAEIVVETTQSFVLIFTVQPTKPAQMYLYRPSTSSSKTPFAPSTKSLRTSFAAAPGEGCASWPAVNEEIRLGSQDGPKRTPRGSPALEISLKLALRVDAGLACCLPTPSHLLISTTSPPAIQMIPWPGSAGSKMSESDSRGEKPYTALLSTMNWLHQPQSAGDSPKQAEADASSSSSSAAPLTNAVHVTSVSHSRAMDLYVWITSDGRAYIAASRQDSTTFSWRGRCFHGALLKRRRSSVLPVNGDTEQASRRSSHATDLHVDVSQSSSRIWHPLSPEMRAQCVSINAKMGLLAVGQTNGTIAIYILRSQTKAILSHNLELRSALGSTASYLATGDVETLQWTSDGLGLAVGWQKGWAVWSAWGKLMGHSFTEDFLSSRHKSFGDVFMDGIRSLFWGPGGSELFVLANSERKVPSPSGLSATLFAIPHAKSAVAGQHSPDNTRFAFIQLDDALLVYRGSEQPDMSIINPDSDVWQNIKVPSDYLALNWPIQYACISSDGLLIAVAGRRGLAHYSATSGRWKQFTKSSEEEGFVVRGGLQWFEHVLIVACQNVNQADGTIDEHGSQLRLYSRDADLVDSNLLHVERLPSPVVLTSLFEDSLLVYTSDNTFYHFLIIITKDSITLQLCGSITFEGVVGEPERVRGLSWMIPKSQQQFGDPMNDLTVATIIFLVDGKLVLLRPRKGGSGVNSSTSGSREVVVDASEEVAYDMQILGDRIEYYWTHLSGIGTLENSLWGYDGSGIKLWLDALTIEHAEPRQISESRGSEEEWDVDDADGEVDEDEMPEYKTIQESLSMPLSFYPLCVVLEKGIIIGVEPEVSIRKNLDFAIFRGGTATHLFLDRLLRYYLEQGRSKEAVRCANSYSDLVYFGHALEILLHAVLEDEADAAQQQAIQPLSDVNGAGMPQSSSSGSIIEHSLDSVISQSTSQSSDLGNATTDNPKDTLSRAARMTTFTPERRHRRNLTRAQGPLLPDIIDFLDHFDEALSVIVNCARKTEIVRWDYLFSHLGPNVTPRTLFEACLDRSDFRTAGSYLLVLHTLQDEGHDEGSGAPSDREELTARLLRMALHADEAGDSAAAPSSRSSNLSLCKDLLRYTHSMDVSGRALKGVIEMAGLLDEEDSEAGQELAGARISSPVPPASSTDRLKVGLGNGIRRSSTASLVSVASSLETPNEQDEDEQAFAPHLQTSFSGSETGQRSRTSSSVLSTHPPIPTVSVNGRVLPAQSPSQGTASRWSPHEFLGRRASDGSAASRSPGHSPGLSISPPRGGARSGSTPFIHSVGLRSSLSTDHLFRGTPARSPTSESKKMLDKESVEVEQ